MKKRSKIVLSLTLAALFIVLGVFAHKSTISWRWNNAVSAAGSMPYQIGLTKVIIIPCVTTGIPPVCVGGTLCQTLDVGRCSLYSDVSGSPAGGMGSMALFQKIAIAKAGLMPGGQLIAGGMSPVFMDSGVLASAGGCYGCTVKSGTGNRFLAWLEKLDKYIIAGFKGK
jgi:hypothetical protein